ncbi:RHS repeat domain-containing protein [Desulfonema ishimotonii]|uniref:RHS repeat domain-containing protein n=1 Tax=Desulfonema ishimotonii TaxID=45657 RepID=UPI000F55D506|nr:RHS repeat-associated core domain-containing protein [Desulfonema ishimotonii]
MKNGVVTYSYVPESDLLKTVTSGGLETTYSYEPKRNLKTQVLNSWNGPSIVSQYDYKYDELGRRKSVENSGAAFAQTRHNIHTYNDRNELTGSERKAGTVAAPAATVDAEGRLYEYDPIGNRTYYTEGTDPQVEYERNKVNQYTGLSADGSALPSPAYDHDGNMTGYDGNTYTWNAENRLTAVETADRKITFLYDYMGRRVRKQVYGGTPGNWNTLPDETRVFVYDGWNLIRETVTGTASDETYYVWGLDLSQSVQGAGGIGGLLCSVSGGEVRQYTYDANGNVGQLVDEDGLIVAHYEYDPFGNEIRADGAGAQDNPFRFSTKYLDAETGLYYYGFRYYSAELGRWISRDPIAEQGGNNLYVYCQNTPNNLIDLLGKEVPFKADNWFESDSEKGALFYNETEMLVYRFYIALAICANDFNSFVAWPALDLIVLPALNGIAIIVGGVESGIEKITGLTEHDLTVLSKETPTIPFDDIIVFSMAAAKKAPKVLKAYRSLNDTDIENILKGTGVVRKGREGNKAIAETIAENARDTAYIPATESFSYLKWRGDKDNYIKFRTDKVKYLSQEEILKNKNIKKMLGRKIKWVKEQKHGIVKGKIPMDAIETIVINGEVIKK